MQKLIQYAKENNYNAITGTLVDKDADHRERQIHFYKKFGFEMLPNE
jgi:GNAT superfamily N-acetyltransferase